MHLRPSCPEPCPGPGLASWPGPFLAPLPVPIRGLAPGLLWSTWDLTPGPLGPPRTQPHRRPSSSPDPRKSQSVGGRGESISQSVGYCFFVFRFYLLICQSTRRGGAGRVRGSSRPPAGLIPTPKGIMTGSRPSQWQTLHPGSPPGSQSQWVLVPGGLEGEPRPTVRGAPGRRGHCGAPPT